jgi:phage shock protein A
MSSLFDKLNTLLRAKVSGMVDDVTGRNPRPQERPEPLPTTVEGLRERINQAVAYEEKLQQQINDQEDEIAALDAQADRAVSQGKEALARHLIAKVQRKAQHVEMMRADLETHQRVAEELILQVNQLDATLSEVDLPQSDVTPPQQAPTNIPEADDIQAANARMSTVIDDAQKRMNMLGEAIRQREDNLRSQMAADDRKGLATDSQSVSDDLASRLDRLSKK